MKNKKKLSIIIPIYNTNKEYLLNCFNSFENINNKDVEILLIDDGSMDYIAKICDCFEKKNSAFKYIRQDNSGVSSARNKGIENSIGEYILFVDSDDIVSNEYVEDIINEINKKQYDLYLTSWKLRKNGKDRINTYNKFINRDNIIENLICLRIPAAPWAKVYLKSIIDEKDIRFNENLRVGEDLLFNYFYFKNVKSVKVINKAIYIYYCRKNSVMNSSFADKHLDSIKSVEIIEKELKTRNKELNDLIARKCLEYISIYKKIPKQEKQVKNNMKESIRCTKKYLIKNKKFSIKNRLKGLIY